MERCAPEKDMLPLRSVMERCGPKERCGPEKNMVPLRAEKEPCDPEKDIWRRLCLLDRVRILARVAVRRRWACRKKQWCRISWDSSRCVYEDLARLMFWASSGAVYRAGYYLPGSVPINVSPTTWRARSFPPLSLGRESKLILQ
eukprot:1155833-Pelagomonas_calceolata.AAC.7